MASVGLTKAKVDRDRQNSKRAQGVRFAPRKPSLLPQTAAQERTSEIRRSGANADRGQAQQIVRSVIGYSRCGRCDLLLGPKQTTRQAHPLSALTDDASKPAADDRVVMA